MNIVLDANIIITALLGSRGKLNILTSQNHTFYAPKKIIDEIKKYKKEIKNYIIQALIVPVPSSQLSNAFAKGLPRWLHPLAIKKFENFLDRCLN